MKKEYTGNIYHILQPWMNIIGLTAEVTLTQAWQQITQFWKSNHSINGHVGCQGNTGESGWYGNEKPVKELKELF
jgi:hypothetical protein